MSNRIMVKRIEGTATAPQTSSCGEVLFAGSGLSVKVGDKVIFNESYGMQTEVVDGQKVLILSEADILAVL